METSNKNFKEYYVIDLAHIAKAIFRKAWAIILAGVITASIGFSMAAFFIEPLYSSSVRLYVNNSSLSLGGASLSITACDACATLQTAYGDYRTALHIEFLVLLGIGINRHFWFS